MAAYTQAWEAVPPGHDDRLDYAIDLADTLWQLQGRSAEQLELLITAQAEIRDRRRSADEPSWARSANLLGDAYRERAESRADQAAPEADQAAPEADQAAPEADQAAPEADQAAPEADQAAPEADQAAPEADLALALAAYTQAWEAVPPGHDDRLDYAIDLADTLWQLQGRSAEQLELLITAQAEIRDRRRSADEPSWARSAHLLGDAYRERAESRADQAAREADQAAPEADQAAREADLALALAAYTQAWEAVPPGHDDRLDYAIDLANTLRDLPGRSAEQLELLITAQAEIRDRRRSADEPSWARSANLLGDAYRERAESRADQAAREADLALALAAYTQAWEAVPPGHDDRLVFAIDLADTLRDLPGRSAEQLELLITAQAEIRDRRRSADEPSWARSAHLLGDAYRERAESRADQAAPEADQAAPEADQAAPEADQAAPEADQAAPEADQAAPEADQAAPEADQAAPEADQAAPEADQAAPEADQAAREADLALALAAYTQAWEAVPPGHDDRLDYAIDLADTLWQLQGRSAEQLELLITAQAEIRDRRRSADEPSWARSAHLLGDAYRERAESRADQAAREADLALALAAYTQAWEAVPPGHDDRLVFAIDLADTLWQLQGRSAEQLELLITAQAEIRYRRRSADEPSWARSAHLLGDAYRERAESRADQAAPEADLALALAAYTKAWEAVPPGHDDRLDYAIDLANTLWQLQGRSAEQLELLITVAAEIRDRQRSADEPSWARSANLLGDAYRERAESRADQAAREADLALALAAYTQAWEAVPPGHDDRLVFAIDLANTLRDLPGRSAEQLELLITAQAEIRDRRRSADEPSWARSAHLLGDAYRERAESRADQAAREADLALALAAYTQAWEAVPPGHDDRLDYAIDLANTLVVQAAIRPAGTMDGRVVVDHALDLVFSAIPDRERDDLAELRKLLPVLSVQLFRQQWSWI